MQDCPAPRAEAEEGKMEEDLSEWEKLTVAKGKTLHL